MLFRQHHLFHDFDMWFEKFFFCIHVNKNASINALHACMNFTIINYRIESIKLFTVVYDFVTLRLHLYINMK